MTQLPDRIFHAARQARKAIARGDLDAAFKWTFILDRQVEVVERLIAIDEKDSRLKRHRSAVVGVRAAMLAVASLNPPAKLAGGEG